MNSSAKMANALFELSTPRSAMVGLSNRANIDTAQPVLWVGLLTLPV
jgi:hypothetical protein